MSAKRTDALRPGDLVEIGDVTATRVVKSVDFDGGMTMRVTFEPDIYVEDKPAATTAHQSKLWILPANQEPRRVAT